MYVIITSHISDVFVKIHNSTYSILNIDVTFTAYDVFALHAGMDFSHNVIDPPHLTSFATKLHFHNKHNTFGAS